MTQQQYVGDSRGATPVIGIVLLVAITTILAATIGMAVTGEVDRNTTPVPSVSFAADYDAGTDTLTINHESGSAFEGSEVHIKIDSGSGFTVVDTWGTDTVHAGDSKVLTGITTSDVVIVVWDEPVEGGKSVILYTWRGADA